MIRLFILSMIVLLAAVPAHAEESIYTETPLKGWSVEWLNEDTVFEEKIPLAEQGDRNALVTLSFMYRNGFGVQQDYVAAYMWADIAADLGDEASRYARDSIARNLSSPEIKEARRMADEWIEAHPELLER